MPNLKGLITQKWQDMQIDKPLGSGACGTVYACTKKSETTGIESKEAVKVVRVLFPEAAHRQAEEEGISFEEYYQRVKAEKSREIELLVNLKSPHIVHINEFDAIEEPDRSAFYLLIRMDLLAALDTFRAEHLADEPQQAAAYAKKVGMDICDALRVCHENGICHRDIKPANILYGTTGDFYLGDFGVSQYTAADVTLTSTGTSRYAPPEQLAGGADARSDIYALGLVLYELTNHWRAPFLPAYPAKINAEDRYTAQCKRLAGDTLPPPDNATPELAAIILKMCAPDPADRYQTVQEVMAALTPGVKLPLDKKRRKRRIRFAVGLGAAAVLVAVGIALTGRHWYIPPVGTVFEERDTTAWDYARQNNITLSDRSHTSFNGGAYCYPCQTDGFHEYFEPDGVTDWGATALYATVTGAQKSEPDADGNVTYTITYAARAQFNYTVAEGAEAFMPGIDMRSFEVMDLRSGYVFPLGNLNGAQESTPRQFNPTPVDCTFSYQGKQFPLQIFHSETWDYTLPDYTVPGSYETPVVVYYTYSITAPQELDSLALYMNTTPYTGYSHQQDAIARSLDAQEGFAGFENYCFMALEDLVADFAAAPGTEAPDAGSYLEKMGAKLSTDTSFTVPNGCSAYLTNPANDYEPITQDDIGEGNFVLSGPSNADVTITGATRSEPDASNNVTYTITFDTTATLQYGYPKSLYDDGTITSIGQGRCFAGFGLLDGQTGTVFAPQLGDGNWYWSVPYLGYQSYTSFFRTGADIGKAYSDDPPPTRTDPCKLVRPMTEYTLDDGKTCRIAYAEVGNWDFGTTTFGQSNIAGQDGTEVPMVVIVDNDTTMHGAIEINVNADYDDLVLYYNGQPFAYDAMFPYSVWEEGGDDEVRYLDELGYFYGLHNVRFYKLDNLVKQFS